MIFTKPTDPYSNDWQSYWSANRHLHRGIGAQAADEVAADANADNKGIDKGGDNGTKGDVTAAKDGGVSDTDLKGASDLLDGDWRSDLPDDLKETAKRFASKADAVRAIIDFRKRESQVRVPGKNATAEEVAAYRKAVGVPDKAEDYEFPEIDKEDMTTEVTAARAAWGKRFHDLGVTKPMAKALLAAVGEEAERNHQAQIKADKAFADAQETALRSEWKGEEFDRNKTLANRAFSDIANRAGLKVDDLTKIETKDGRFLMDRAEIVRIFAHIGREMAEGVLGPTLTESEKDTVDDQIKDVRTQVAAAQSEGNSKLANKLYQKEQALIAKKSGNQAIVGSRGRMV